MEFDDVILNLKKLVGLPLQPFSDNEKSLSITDIDHDLKKITLITEGQKRSSIRIFIELECVFTELI